MVFACGKFILKQCLQRCKGQWLLGCLHIGIPTSLTTSTGTLLIWVWCNSQLSVPTSQINGKQHNYKWTLHVFTFRKYWKLCIIFLEIHTLMLVVVTSVTRGVTMVSYPKEGWYSLTQRESQSSVQHGEWGLRKVCDWSPEEKEQKGFDEIRKDKLSRKSRNKVQEAIIAKLL